MIKIRKIAKPPHLETTATTAPLTLFFESRSSHPSPSRPKPWRRVRKAAHRSRRSCARSLPLDCAREVAARSRVRAFTVPFSAASIGADTHSSSFLFLISLSLTAIKPPSRPPPIPTNRPPHQEEVRPRRRRRRRQRWSARPRTGHARRRSTVT